jgi:hypothetical protein
MVILYLPYVKPSQYLNEGKQNKLSGGVTYKIIKITFYFFKEAFNFPGLTGYQFPHVEQVYTEFLLF